MLQTCINCGKGINNPGVVISECPFCFEKMEGNNSVNEPNVLENESVWSLRLSHIATGFSILSSFNHSVVLGRSSVGADFFSSIKEDGFPVISRRHCEISFLDGSFYLCDLNSLNGTFINDLANRCLGTKLEIFDDSIIYLGREKFIINFIKRSIPDKGDVIVDNNANESKKVSIIYKCNDINCSGYESDEKFEICKVCHAVNNIIELRR